MRRVAGRGRGSPSEGFPGRRSARQYEPVPSKSAARSPYLPRIGPGLAGGEPDPVGGGARVSRFGSTATVGILRTLSADDREAAADPTLANSADSRGL